MTRSLFSVVIPTRNRRGLLARALQSVRLQSSAPLEVIVVDDGSTDDTLEFLATQADVRVARSPGGGPGAARNTGAELAAGDYLAFLDSDDLWFPWTLAAMADAIEGHGRPAYVAGSFKQFTDERELAGEMRTITQARGFENYFSTWPAQLVFGAGMIAVRRDAFLECGGFSTQAINLEDHDLSLRLGLASGFVQIDRPVTIGWCQHPEGVTRDIHKSAQGCALVVSTEKRGGYPGGSEWSRVRRNIITTHTRAFSLEALRAGHAAEAWAVYRETLAWHLSLGRLRYVAAFPLLMAMRSLKPASA
jgi:glycosyltransferase involved in cell wall biosynthesis